MILNGYTETGARPIVSYGTNKYKAISVPLLKLGDTGESIWQGAVEIKDIHRFKSGEQPVAVTEVCLVRDGAVLHIKVSCFEPEPERINANNPFGTVNLWDGDLIEVFFGAVEPVPWLYQLAVGAGGGRFDSSGNYDLWSAETSRNEKGWHAEIKIPFTMLRMFNLAVGFNICRQNLSRNEYSSWMGLEQKFHESENFGKLLFCDYNTAFFAQTGVLPEKKLSRTEFENRIAATFIPAERVTHGPWLSNPAPDSMTVSWGTAGMAGAMLEYREHGSIHWITLPMAIENGILKQNLNLHTANLNSLKPGTRYDYRLVNLSPLRKTRSAYPAKGVFTFETLDPAKKAFSFAICSDIHSNVGVLRNLLTLPENKKTDFFVNLGDMLSCMNGRDSFYDGFLDAESELYGKTRPLVFVRGNHEQIGLFAGEYSNVMSHPSNKTYYAFRHGEVCFLALDTGNDKPDDAESVHWNMDMIVEQREWLSKIVAGDDYKNAKFRIAFLHMPPCTLNDNSIYYSMAAVKLMDGLLTDTGIDNRLHLLICGHLHNYLRLEPESGKIAKSRRPLEITADTPVLPFSVVANDTDTAIVVNVAHDALEIEVITDAAVRIDAFSVFPDGRVGDNMQ